MPRAERQPGGKEGGPAGWEPALMARREVQTNWRVDADFWRALRACKEGRFARDSLSWSQGRLFCSGSETEALLCKESVSGFWKNQDRPQDQLCTFQNCNLQKVHLQSCLLGFFL